MSEIRPRPRRNYYEAILVFRKLNICRKTSYNNNKLVIENFRNQGKDDCLRAVLLNNWSML